MSRIKDFVQVLEAWLPSPNDTVQLEEWSKTADYIAYTYEFSEYEQIYVDTLLDMYEEQFREIISSTSNTSNTVLSKEYMDTFLLSRTQVEQRTEAWYRQMATIISASELGNLFASPYQRSKFVVTKSQPYQMRQQNTAVSSHHMTAFDWGIRFEPVVKQIYEYKYGAVIKDLGRMIHPTEPRCAASPDGLIYHCPEGKQGHLIEIKCPVTREIDGSVPKDYYHQMQMQLHCTGLNECVYLETKFKQISYAEWLKTTNKKGCFALKKDQVSYCSTTYDEWYSTLTNIFEWNVIFWIVEKTRTSLVQKDPSWLTDHIQSFKQTWDEVLEYRKTGTLPVPKEKGILVLNI